MDIHESMEEKPSEGTNEHLNHAPSTPASHFNLESEITSNPVATSVGANNKTLAGIGLSPSRSLDDSNQIETALGKVEISAIATTVVETNEASSRRQATIEHNSSMDTDLVARADEVHERALESLEHDQQQREKDDNEMVSVNKERKEEMSNRRNANGAKRPTGQGMDINANAMKKMKLEDLPMSPDQRRAGCRIAHPSPVYIATGWPHRSPMEAKPQPRGDVGEEHRCRTETNSSVNASSSTNSSNRAHEDVAHALFTESFDTISACGSAMAVPVAVQEQQLNADGILSPRQKAHNSPHVERDASDHMGMLSQRKKSGLGQYQSSTNSTAAGAGAYHEYHLSSERSFSGETREESTTNKDMDSFGQGHQSYRDGSYDHSPRSPPQRVVELDGDDHGCGDISPIKFSPPTAASPSRQRDHLRGRHHGDHLARYQRDFPLNDERHHRESRDFSLEPSFPSDTYDKEHVAEVSFDTSAGGTNSDPHQDDSNRKSNGNHYEKGIRCPLSTLSAPKSPLRHDTSGSESTKGNSMKSDHDRHTPDHEREENTTIDDFSKGQHHVSDRAHNYHGNHLSLYSTAPPLPRDLSSPGRHIGHHYSNHPPILSPNRELRLPYTSNNLRAKKKEQRRTHPRVGGPPFYKADKMVKSSPIRSERSRHPIWPKQELQFPQYGDTANTAPPAPSHLPYVGASWTGPPEQFEHRGYPPPPTRLPPSAFYPNQYNHDVDQYTALPTCSQNEHNKAVSNASREHVKGTEGTAPDAPHPRHYRKVYHQHPPQPPLPPAPPFFSPQYTHHNNLSYVAKDFFNLLRSVRKVFQGCSYLLYPTHMGVNWSGDHQVTHTDPEDLKVAQRRVESAICALGGYIKDIREAQHSPDASPLFITNKSSAKPSSSPSMPCHIFRRRDGSGNNTSIIGTSSSRSSDYYRDRFHMRYFIGGHGVSWEVEENPPVFVSMDEKDQLLNRDENSMKNNRTSRNSGAPSNTGTGVRQSSAPYDSEPSSLDSKQQSSGVIQVDHNQKMKYRCKLCGQPKQNHVCPYRKSLVRTIGVMVCPAVNSYASSEPGVLTPALTAMNNFVPYGRQNIGDESTDQDTEVSSRDHSSHGYRLTPGGSKKANEHHHYSPATSSLSTSPHSNNHQSPAGTQQQQQQQQLLGRQHHANYWQGKARATSQPGVLSLVLRAEHYRVVTPRTFDRSTSSKRIDERDDKEEFSFEYPHVPLTYSGRKRLTDTLFYLSQRIPSVMADVASLLRMARERDEWDLAVAEVLTQVVICIHCSEGDYQLNGLRKYLLKIGIAS